MTKQIFQTERVHTIMLHQVNPSEKLISNFYRLFKTLKIGQTPFMHAGYESFADQRHRCVRVSFLSHFLEIVLIVILTANVATVYQEKIFIIVF